MLFHLSRASYERTIQSYPACYVHELSNYSSSPFPYFSKIAEPWPHDNTYQPPSFPISSQWCQILHTHHRDNHLYWDHFCWTLWCLFYYWCLLSHFWTLWYDTCYQLLSFGFHRILEGSYDWFHALRIALHFWLEVLSKILVWELVWCVRIFRGPRLFVLEYQEETLFI